MSEKEMSDEFTICFRLKSTFMKAIAELMEKKGLKKRTDYLRGLIYLDAALSRLDTDVLDKDAWVTQVYGDLIRSWIAERNAEDAREAVSKHKRRA